MIGQQKEHITAMRMQGIDYSTIAKSLGLKKETVAAFCRKNGLSGVKAADSRVIPSQTDTCLVCGTVLVQIPCKKTSFLFGQVPHTLVERTPGYGDPTLSSAGTAESPLWHSETAVGNTVPFPAPSLKESYPCLNPIVSASPPCCAAKGSIPFGILRTSLHPNATIFPQKHATTSSNIYRPNSLLSAA